MLKKAAIIVAGSAAVILAASPLALADSFDHSPQCISAAQGADNSVNQASSAAVPALGAAGICLTDRDFGPWAAEVWPGFNDAVVAELR